ncbi:VG15 protein [Streptomyces celluloflavus]|uniref:VG15 protein n=1 Tax=Streptomyces celluloflavus TaxID=58344 RepID=UPI0036AEEC87
MTDTAVTEWRGPVRVESLAAAYYRRQNRLAAAASRLAAQWWRRMPRADIDLYWRLHAAALWAIVAAMQEQAAEGADAYVDAVLAAQGVAPDPAGRVRVSAFVGRAADGRALDSLLYQPLITTKTLIGRGLPEGAAFERGLAELLNITGSEIADAGRSAAGVRIAADRGCAGYVRMCSAGACARCSILAGRVYAVNQGFRRHRRCHCYHVPMARKDRWKQLARTYVEDPREHFERLSRADQDRLYTKAGAAAIRDGADIAQVVNIRRGGLYTADVFGRRVKATYEGTRGRAAPFVRSELRRAIESGQLPRGHSGRGWRPKSPRLTPEAIYKAADSRDEVIRMLERYGYIY